MFDNDAFSRKPLVEWFVSRFFAIGSSLGRSNRGMRLSVAGKTTITENSRATGKPPFFKINATLIMPSARSGFAQQHNPSSPDSDDVLNGVSLFAPTVTCLAGHAVLGAATRAVCAINDKREGRELSHRFCEVMSFAFWQAEFAFEGSFEDGRQAVCPLTGLCLAHPKEECHHVKGRVDLEPKKNEKEFIPRSAQHCVSSSAESALSALPGAQTESCFFGGLPRLVECWYQGIELACIHRGDRLDLTGLKERRKEFHGANNSSLYH